MKGMNVHFRTKPEAVGAGRLRRHMEARQWLIKKLHGGKYQSGLPDLLCLHAQFGLRWIETKAPSGKLRRSQRDFFADMAVHGEKIWVMFDETDYHKLFDRLDNWRDYI